jgi:hypothetical protein
MSPELRKRLRPPVLLLAWLGGSLILAPVLLALAGFPQLLSDAIAGALFVLPISWWIVVHGRADGARDRVPRMVAFAAFTLFALIVGVMLAVTDETWGAVAAVCTALVFASVVLANYRSKEAGVGGQGRAA